MTKIPLGSLENESIVTCLLGILSLICVLLKGQFTVTYMLWAFNVSYAEKLVILGNLC